MPLLVDSNVLLDVLTDSGPWRSWSAAAIEQFGHSQSLVINPVIYGEVSVRFTRIEELDDALPTAFFQREPIPYAAAFLAGKAFSAYRRAGGPRSSTLPDFFIGAHAAIAGYALLTRDVRRYKTYFPTVELVCPPNS